MNNKNIYHWVQPWKSGGYGSLGAAEMVYKRDVEKIILECNQLKAEVETLKQIIESQK